MNALLVNNTVLEVSEECMQILLTVARSMSATVTTSTTIKDVVQKPKKTPTVYEHVTEDFTDFTFHCTDNKVTYTHKDGSYLKEKAVRKILNSRLKNSGFVYVDKGVWELSKKGKRDIVGAKRFVENALTIVSADEINVIHDEWTENSKKNATKQR